MQELSYLNTEFGNSTETDYIVLWNQRSLRVNIEWGVIHSIVNIWIKT